jgi:hypothetical protein
MEQQIMRADGIPVPVSIADIKERVERAQYASIHVENNAMVWFRYYNDTPDNNQLINDFKRLIWLNEKLQSKIRELEYELESKS